MNLVDKALVFATNAHGTQVRKYSGEPYVNHCVEVANILKQHGFGVEDCLAAAILHDVVEDTNASFTDIKEEFGPNIMGLVWWLTDLEKPEHGNRETRKELTRVKYRGAPRGVVYIKLADMISNTADIVKHDKDFAKVYLEEKEKLLEEFKMRFNYDEIASKLIATADKQIAEGKAQL